MNRGLALGLVVCGLVGGAVAGRLAGRGGVVRDGPPDLVLVIGCTLRRDQIGVYGGHPRATPFLDSLARRGVRFADGVAAAPWTRAASTALLTGHHAIDVGMVERGPGPNEKALPGEVQTLAEALARSGYQTIGTTANPNLNAVFGFDQGFDHYLEVSPPWSDGMVKVDGAEVVDGLLGAVDTHRDPSRPLYLQALLVDAHEPRTAPRVAVEQLSSEEVPPRVAEYRYSVRTLDEAIGRLDAGLRARGLDPIFVVVSDHGEGLLFPPHHGRGHGIFTYPSTVAMPWLIAGPGVASGAVVEGVVSGVDVKATLLGLVGAKGEMGSGVDLSEQVRHGGRSSRQVAWVDTWFQRASRAASYDERWACHHDAEPSVISRRPATACYDRGTDPDAHEWIEPMPAAGDALVAWRAERVAELERRGGAESVEVDEELKRQLEALGYLQGGVGEDGL